MNDRSNGKSKDGQSPSNSLLIKGAGLAAPVAISALLCTFFCAPLLSDKGWNECVHFLGPLFGTLALVVAAFIAFAGLLSIPVTGFLGLTTLALTFKHGFKMAVYGLIAVAASAFHLFWWIKYGGLPV